VADPIQPVITALSTVFATPQASGPASVPNSWKNGTATPANAAVAGAITTLMKTLYTVSKDMSTVGSAISTALTDVAGVVSAIADQLQALPSASDVASAMGQLQQGLTLAQTLAPTGPVAVLDSAGQLFKQLQDLLTATPDPKQAAIELYKLAQQLSLIASDLKP
jgi:hypothetical protein